MMGDKWLAALYAEPKRPARACEYCEDGILLEGTDHVIVVTLNSIIMVRCQLLPEPKAVRRKPTPKEFAEK